jgi:hypothetical protein
VEDWRKNVWVGGWSSPFFVDDDIPPPWKLIIKRKRNFGTLWKLVFFFWSSFYLYCSSSFLFDDDAITFSKESKVGKNIYILCCLNLGIALLIFVTIIIVVEHFSYCYYCFNYFGNKLKKKYVEKCQPPKCHTSGCVINVPHP